VFKKKEEMSLNSYRYCTYLIGSMEKPAEGDGGEKKRAGLQAELLKRNVYPINPCDQERAKVGMDTQQLKEQMVKCEDEENYSEYGHYGRLIWKGKDIIDEKGGLIHIPGDFDYCDMSDFLTFILHAGDKPCGSYGETFIGFKIDKPIYLITDIPIKKLSGSLKQAVFGSRGYVFDSENAYLHFLENTYGLTRKD